MPAHEKPPAWPVDIYYEILRLFPLSKRTVKALEKLQKSNMKKEAI